MKVPEEEVQKRPRDAITEQIIQGALEDEQHEKKARKQVRFTEEPVVKKGKTLAEIEDEEGGPVKESLVGMAQTKRALSRKGKQVDDAEEDTELPAAADVEKYEEQLEVEQEEGITFEPFNLKAERETGHFDEDGNYVESKETGAADAWLDSEEAKVVSDKVKKMIEERQKAAEANYQGPMTDKQLALLKAEVAAKLQPGETIAKALKRLGGNAASHKAMGKREKARLALQTKTPQQLVDAEAINQLTECADKLLDEGELDVYSCTKEDFERAAALFLPKAPAASVAGDDDEKDMFADDDEDMFNAQDKAAATTSAELTADAEASSIGSVPTFDYSTWSVSQLKQFLGERGEDVSKYLEKEELVARAKELSSQKGDSSDFVAPPGYQFDPNTSFYYNSETNLYYDPNSGGYCDATSNQWYTYNNDTQQFVPWSSGGDVS